MGESKLKEKVVRPFYAGFLTGVNGVKREKAFNHKELKEHRDEEGIFLEPLMDAKGRESCKGADFVATNFFELERVFFELTRSGFSQYANIKNPYSFLQICEA